MCPHACAVDRRQGQGVCRAPEELSVSNFNLHFGEEPPVSGERGSGTIFLTHCNLHCVFCQNYPISQLGRGETYSVEKFADLMLSLQKRGAHNINFVSPTHYSWQLAAAIKEAAACGLTIPIVWNSNGYESVEVLQQLENVIDIYMPDIKYSCEEPARRLSGAPGYWDHVRPAILEMQRQVGPLECDDDGIAERGLLIRHLVLPDDLSGTRAVLKFIAEEVGRRANLSLMSQYFPAHKALEMPDMARRLKSAEYEQAIEWLEEFDLSEAFIQYEILDEGEENI